MDRSTPEVAGRVLATAAATAAAGPTFTAMFLSLPGSAGGLLFWPIAWFGISFMFLMFAVAMAIGPVALAVYIGGWLGQRWRWSRHPAIWAVVGASAGWMLVPVAAGTMLPVVPSGAGIATGMVIALVARRLVDWID